MSRIGKKPIPVPSGVDVSFDGQRVTVKGPKGELTLDVEGDIEIVVEDGEALVRRGNDERRNRALHGLYRALLAN
ncbi:MAG TPA: 50S ribosomal protein L6, partial [Acidimicrobiia bacterium]|nr:50S ribosomal protein L6 [Acidimicrobiia bacterium]